MDLLILGASARAAAFSALRIGLKPTCLDLSADLDLAAACPALRVDPRDYPDALAGLAAGLPPMPWLYTGALENRPDLVDRVSSRHDLLGNPGAVLRAARDPIAVAEAVREAGLAAPGVRLDPAGLPLDGSWLRKPLASAGGRGVVPWVGRPVDSPRPAYYQERIAGLPASALFAGERSGGRFLGLTRQFVGKGANRFAYRGSLAPWPVLDEVRDRVERLGEAIARRFGLVGLFGVDLILRDDQAWPVEVNPRYTASVEVVERALGRSLLAEHLRACGRAVDIPNRVTDPEGFAAKAIVFADREFRWPEAWAIDEMIADVPHPGTPFRAGEPVLTVFARGDDPTDCRQALAGQIRAWRRRIRSTSDRAIS